MEYSEHIKDQVKGKSDLGKLIKSVVSSLINGNIDSLVAQGAGNFTGLNNIINRRREYHWRLEGAPDNPPDGLYWLAIPPEHVIREAIIAGGCSRIDRSSSFFKNRLKAFPDSSSLDFWSFTINDVADNINPIPDSTWSLEVPMWTEKGPTQLTLRLEAIITSGRAVLKIEDLEIM